MGNIITKSRRIALAKISSGAISTIPAITHICFGNGGVDASGEPKNPPEAQSTLYNEVKRYAVGSITYPVATTTRYTVIIPPNDLVGENINEMGLIDSAGNLCAMKTMYNKRKDENTKFTFEFDDEY